MKRIRFFECGSFSHTSEPYLQVRSRPSLRLDEEDTDAAARLILVEKITELVEGSCDFGQAVRKALMVLCDYTGAALAHVWVRKPDATSSSGPGCESSSRNSFSWAPQSFVKARASPHSAKRDGAQERFSLQKRNGNGSIIDGLGNAIVFPIVSEQEVIAMVELFTARAWQQERWSFLPTISALLAGVWQREAMRQRIEREEKRVRCLLQANGAGVFIANGETGVIEEANQAFLRLLGFKRQTIRNGELNWKKLTAPEFKAADEGAHQELKAKGTCSPYEKQMLRSNGKLAAVLMGMVSLQTENKPPRLIGFVNALTDARSLERHILQITDREKQMLGHDLHDGLGQLLTGIRFRLSSLGQRFKRQGQPEVSELERLVSLASQAEATCHDLAQGLQPIRSGVEGLVTGLKDLALIASELYQRPCTFRYRLFPTIPDEIALHLYRICQEAVTNAMKHGRPKRVSITLATQRGRLTLEVRDDGTGLSRPKAGRRGLGLEILRYRARLIGAQLSFKSRAGQGTVVRCVLPRPT